MMRARWILVVLVVTACGASSKKTTSSGPSKVGTTEAPALDSEQAFAVVKRLQAALAARDVTTLSSVGHPTDGIFFWTQPGAYPSPTSHFEGSKASMPEAIHTEALARMLETGLRVAGVDRPAYELPPEEEIGDAPAWASLRTQNVTFTAADWPALEEEPKVMDAVSRATFRYELEIEVGYEGLFVYLVEEGGHLYVAHMISFTHYSA